MEVSGEVTCNIQLLNNLTVVTEKTLQVAGMEAWVWGSEEVVTAMVAATRVVMASP